MLLERPGWRLELLGRQWMELELWSCWLARVRLEGRPRWEAVLLGGTGGRGWGDLAGDHSSFLAEAGVLGARGMVWPSPYSSTAWDCTGAMEGGMSPMTEQRSSME